MTNINCSKDCQYQSDGKCCYDIVHAFNLNFYNTEDLYCAYYQKKDGQGGDPAVL